MHTTITIRLDDAELSAEDIALLKRCLGLAEGASPSTAFRRLAKSAFLEYRNMFVGRGLPTRANEVMQDRLRFLIQNYFIDRLPLESEISAIFQLPPSQSRTLLRNTKSRYRTEIVEIIHKTIRVALKSATQSDDHWVMVILSDVVREEMNFIIGQTGPTLRLITKLDNSANQYKCSNDSYKLLSKAV